MREDLHTHQCEPEFLFSMPPPPARGRAARPRDPEQQLTLLPIGVNSNYSKLTRLCPRRDYRVCFGEVRATMCTDAAKRDEPESPVCRPSVGAIR
jgi:hypothetical protein